MLWKTNTVQFIGSQIIVADCVCASGRRTDQPLPPTIITLHRRDWIETPLAEGHVWTGGTTLTGFNLTLKNISRSEQLLLCMNVCGGAERAAPRGLGLVLVSGRDVDLADTQQQHRSADVLMKLWQADPNSSTQISSSRRDEPITSDMTHPQTQTN